MKKYQNQYFIFRGLGKKIIFLASVALAGCEPQVHQRGFNAECVDFDSIKVGVDTKETVRQKLGSPSAAASFNSNAWYYSSQVTSQQSFLDMEVKDKKLVVIEFDKHNRVKSLNKNFDGCAQNIKPVERKTKTLGDKDTVWKEIMGNFGNFYKRTGTTE